MTSTIASFRVPLVCRQRLVRPTYCRRLLATTTSTVANEPFYGHPRPVPTNRGRSVLNRASVAFHYAMTAFADPTRADAVAALGELTGPVSLRRILNEMKQDPVGRRILQDRPIVSKATIPYQDLMDKAPDTIHDDDHSGITFGQAYGHFLKSHNFDPDERDQVRFIEDDELAYVMLRYRQCHDFWHTLTGLPPTVLGELGLKWLELFQTKLPIAALSSTVGALRLDPNEREVLINHYLPWALEQSQQVQIPLMNVYYEEELDTPLQALRARMNLQPAPTVNHILSPSSPF